MIFNESRKMSQRWRLGSGSADYYAKAVIGLATSGVYEAFRIASHATMHGVSGVFQRITARGWTLEESFTLRNSHLNNRVSVVESCDARSEGLFDKLPCG